jgi:hypothetical protein
MFKSPISSEEPGLEATYLKTVSAPVVLVGHSYGGSAIGGSGGDRSAWETERRDRDGEETS